MASGPVDAYLALAAAATGERELAARHADDAAALAREWEIPLFGLAAGLRETTASERRGRGAVRGPPSADLDRRRRWAGLGP